jgi:hypothetical protein
LIRDNEISDARGRDLFFVHKQFARRKQSHPSRPLRASLHVFGHECL